MYKFGSFYDRMDPMRLTVTSITIPTEPLLVTSLFVSCLIVSAPKMEQPFRVTLKQRTFHKWSQSLLTTPLTTTILSFMMRSSRIERILMAATSRPLSSFPINTQTTRPFRYSPLRISSSIRRLQILRNEFYLCRTFTIAAMKLHPTLSHIMITKTFGRMQL